MSDSDLVLRVISNISAIRLDRFNDRMYLQKLGYLIQEIHHENAFNFSWYVRGPYSSTFADSLFYHEKKGTYQISPKLVEPESKTKTRISELLGKNIKDPHTLELYASLWYLMSGKKISSKEKEDILSIMCKEKPHFQRKNIVSALEQISKFRQKHSL